jgi:biotin operon repressor
MSKRVYEIAREQSLASKEVIQRLKEAGVEVKSWAQRRNTQRSLSGPGGRGA